MGAWRHLKSAHRNGVGDTGLSHAVAIYLKCKKAQHRRSPKVECLWVANGRIWGELFRFMASFGQLPGHDVRSACGLLGAHNRADPAIFPESCISPIGNGQGKKDNLNTGYRKNMNSGKNMHKLFPCDMNAYPFWAIEGYKGTKSPNELMLARSERSV